MLLLSIVSIVGIAVVYDIWCNIRLYRLVQRQIQSQEHVLWELQQAMTRDDSEAC